MFNKIILLVIACVAPQVKAACITAYEIQNLNISSHGEQLAARIYMPQNANKPYPVSIVVGPISYVKEQSPKQYATRLASLGIATIIFDPRYFGESTGSPRQFEDPDAKVEDILAVVDYALTRPEFDVKRLSLTGICQGTNWVMKAASKDPRVQRLTLISGHYLYKKYLEEDFFDLFGVPASLEQRVQGGKEALYKFQYTKEVDYIPVVGFRNVTDRLLPGSGAYNFYIPFSWRDPGMLYRGKWENRITKMSEALLWSQEIDKVTAVLKTPVLILLGNKSATPPADVQPLFDSIPIADKHLINIGDHNSHVQFYEDPELIDRCIQEIYNWKAFL